MAANNFRAEKYYKNLCTGYIPNFVKLGQQQTALCTTPYTHFCEHFDRDLRVTLLNIAWIEKYSKKKNAQGKRNTYF